MLSTCLPRYLAWELDTSTFCYRQPHDVRLNSSETPFASFALAAADSPPVRPPASPPRQPARLASPTVLVSVLVDLRPSFLASDVCDLLFFPSLLHPMTAHR